MSTVVVSRRQKFNWKALPLFCGIDVGCRSLKRAARRRNGGLSGISEAASHPPPIVFPIVWGVLYLLMGIAAYLVWNSGDLDRGASLRLYLLQLLVNALWPLLFFRLQWRLAAFFWILLLIALVSLTLTGFTYIRKAAGRLLVPYLLWILFAAYLNLGFYLMNL